MRDNRSGAIFPQAERGGSGVGLDLRVDELRLHPILNLARAEARVSRRLQNHAQQIVGGGGHSQANQRSPRPLIVFDDLTLDL